MATTSATEAAPASIAARTLVEAFVTVLQILVQQGERSVVAGP